MVLAVRPRALLVAAVLLAPLGLAACSDDDSPTEKSDAARAAERSTVEFRRVFSNTSDQKRCAAAPDEPSSEACAALEAFTCPTDAQDLDDDLLLACGTGTYERQAYLLGPAEISQGIESAEAGKPESAAGWAVDLVLTDDAAAQLAALTEELSGTGRQVALVEGGQVVTAVAPYDTISDGRLRIVLGDVTADVAADLAERLGS